MKVFDWILEPANGWKIFGAVVVLVVLLGALVFFTSSDTEHNQQEQTNISSGETTSNQTELKTSIQLLNSAKKLLDKPSLSSAEIEEARRYLSAIPESAEEYKAAQLLLANITSTQSNNLSVLANNQTKPENNLPNKTNKREAVQRMQDEMNSRTPGFSLTLQGSNEDELRFEHPQMSRPLVVQLVNATGFANAMTNLGIKTVIFTNGKGYTSTYNF